MMKNQELFADNPLLIGHDNVLFHPDVELGFRHAGGEFIGANCFVSLEEIVRTTQAQSRPVALNIGDSSTSGWNSDKVGKGKIEDPRAPFFSYKTYSDLIRERGYSVINGGVSGYSSYQGLKQLGQLLKRFATQGISIDFVTLYFGNNDGVFSRVEDKASIDLKRESVDFNLQRVTLVDYKKNITQMVELAREYGANPVVIAPPFNLHWLPGLRSSAHQEEFEQGFRLICDSELRVQLLNARALYAAGNYSKAYTHDRFLPRIKPEYMTVLKKVARKLSTPVIDVQGQLSDDDQNLFGDYCHPLEPINEMIAERFDVIARATTGNRHRVTVSSWRDSIYPLW